MMMMDQLSNCGGWLMSVGSVVILTVLALGAAAAIKYLFFADRRQNPESTAP